jgi:hypothetical protein
MTSPVASGVQTAEDVEEGTVVAVGISSVVVDVVPEGEGLGKEGNLDLLGHVQLLDLDDTRAVDAFEDFSHRDGVVALFESSPGSFHLWSLSVRDLEEHTLDALLTHCEPLHVKQSYRRRRAIIRRSGKYRLGEDAAASERYKEAPRLLRVRYEAPDDGAPQSAAHLALLRVIAREQEADVSIPTDEEIEASGVDLVGRRLIRSDYLTFDDQTKRDRGEETGAPRGEGAEVR